jgi:hypothetical protein
MAGGVVLDADGLPFFVELDAADAVDLAEIAQGGHGGFGGMAFVAVEGFQLSHGYRVQGTGDRVQGSGGY